MNQKSFQGWVGGWVVLASIAWSSAASAAFNPTDFTNVTQGLVESLVKTVALGADHRAFEPASPLGYTIGLDLSVEGALLSLPDEFKTAMTTAGVTGTIPSTLPLPRLNIHKGLPAGFDIGFSYIGFQGNQLLGGDLKWAFLKGGVATPAVAARVSYSKAKLYFLNTSTFKVDALVSKGFAIFEPYAGAGLQFGSGEIEVPVGIPGLPATVSASHSTTALHMYGGLPIKLLVTKITLEYDYSFAGISTFGIKAGLSF